MQRETLKTMHLKAYGYGVILIYTITATITLISQGLCEHTKTNEYLSRVPGESTQQNSFRISADFHNERKGRKTLRENLMDQEPPRTVHPRLRGGRHSGGPRRHYYHQSKPRPAAGTPSFQNLHLDPRRSHSNVGRPIGSNAQRFERRMVSFTDSRFKPRDEKLPSSSSTGSDRQRCTRGQIKTYMNGRFYMDDGRLDTSTPNDGYQSDSLDSAQTMEGPIKIRGQLVNSPEVSWKRLEPVVECGDDAMFLTVRRRRAAQLLLDRVNSSALPLSQLSSDCGYSVNTTWKDLLLVAPYNACYITLTDDVYVLPLLWRGTPVKMSCPVPQSHPPVLDASSLCCSRHDMTVTLQGQSAEEQLTVKVRGEWTPLVSLAQQCGYTFIKRPGELQMAAPFIACGITVKDGKYTLYLQIGERAVTLACPISPPEELAHQSATDGTHYPTKEHTEPALETLRPISWGPPFYLAPLYYPHPTYPQKYSSADNYDASNPSTQTPTVHSQSPLPESQYYYPYHMLPGEGYKEFTISSSPLSPTGGSKDSNGPHAGTRNNKAIPELSHLESHHSSHPPLPAAEFPVHAQPPSLQSSSYTFDQYYHYYHHPKIPVPPLDLRQEDHGPGNEAVNYERYPKDEQPAHTFPPGPEAPSGSTPLMATDPIPATYSPYPPQPYPHHYFYHLPHLFQAELERSRHDDHVTVEPVVDSHTLPILPQPLTYYGFPSYVPEPNPDKHSDPEMHVDQSSHGVLSQAMPEHPGKPQLKQTPALLLSVEENLEEKGDTKGRNPTSVLSASHPLLPPSYHYDPLPKPLKSNRHQGPNPIQLSSTMQSPNPDPYPFPYYFHPSYYYYYHMYHGPESLSNPPTEASPPSYPPAQVSASSAVEPTQLPFYPFYYYYYPKDMEPAGDHGDSNEPHIQTLNVESTYNDQNIPLHPYYYYYRHYYQPVVSQRNQEPHPADGSHSAKVALKNEDEMPSEPVFYTMGSPVQARKEGSPSMHQPQSKPFHNPSIHHIHQQPQDQLLHPDGEETGDRSEPHMRLRDLQASPFVPTASPCGLGPDCSNSLGCSSYTVNDCTVGQHLVFVVPDSVMDLTAVPPDQLSGQVHDGSCMPLRLTSNPDLYTVPLEGCGIHTHVAGQTVVYLLEVQGILYLQQDHSTMHEGSPVRLMVECRSSPGSPGNVRFQVMCPSPPPPVQTTSAATSVQLRLATDESYTSYHREAHLPLSLVQGRPVYIEVGLLNPPETDLVLLVDYCLAYIYTPYPNWMLIYDGCPSRDDSQTLLSPPTHLNHTFRLTVTHFPSLPTGSPSYLDTVNHSHLGEPEIYFLCSTNVCSDADTADGLCSVGCIRGPSNDS